MVQPLHVVVKESWQRGGSQWSVAVHAYSERTRMGVTAGGFWPCVELQSARPWVRAGGSSGSGQTRLPEVRIEWSPFLASE